MPGTTMDYGLLLVLIVLSCSNAIIYDGTPQSWTKYAKWNLCPNSQASLYMTFQTENKDGLLAYMDGGQPSDPDYLLVQLKDGKVAIEYKFGAGAKAAVYTRKEYNVQLNMETHITVTRNRMGMLLEIEGDQGVDHQLANYGSDLCFGDCMDNNQPSPDISYLYVGGLPSDMKSKLRSSVPPFVGKIYHIEYKNCSCKRSNPIIVELGTSLTSINSEDPCFNKTASIENEGCVCRLDRQSQICPCAYDCVTKCSTPDVEYTLSYNQQQGKYLVNSGGLDARVVGTPIVKINPMQYLELGNDNTYAEMAGVSQRDECLGNLALCDKGYTISFWFVILNNQTLAVEDGVIIDNGGYDTHGIAVYWQNNKLITKFKKPDGRTWMNETDALWPAQVYYDGRFVDYWYHYAASWSDQDGLSVYLNGEPAGRPIYREKQEEEVVDSAAPTPMSRTAFKILSSGTRNKIGISEIKFSARHKTLNEIIGLSGPRHYYFSMNRLDGDGRVVAWPPSLNARVKGSTTGQLVKGRADMALKLGRDFNGYSYVDAGDVNHTCFARVKMCDMYTSFWVKFDDLRNGMVVLDTGNEGISIQYRNQRLYALVYTHGFMAPVVLSYPQPKVGEWYFVEFSRKEGLNQLFVNGALVDQRRQPQGRREEFTHYGKERNLMIGAKNGGTNSISGSFTIDELELLQGSREYLLNLGHIQRDIPPHAFYTMDGIDSNGYIIYTSQSIQHNPTPEIRGRSQFVPGKDMKALSLPAGSSFQITNPKRNQECYSNIEKCVHGILVRGWFNIEQLRENAGIMSTGVNGIDMKYQNGRLVVTADTLFRKWEAIADLSPRKWQFLEVSFHPKYGLSVYNDKKKQSESVNFSDKTPDLIRYGSAFMVGGTNDANHVTVPLIVDDLEIWYGQRAYIESKCLLTPCQREHFIIDFDEQDVQNPRLLRHEWLTIPYTGTLEPGYILNAMDVKAGQRAEVTNIKLTGTEVYKSCLGNLSLCSNGFTVEFYLKPKALPPAGAATYYLSTGIEGVDVYYKDGKIHAEARALGRIWKVSSDADYLVKDEFNDIIVAWSPVKGLVLAKDQREYVIDRDFVGQPVSNSDTSSTSRFLIGGSNIQRSTWPPEAAFDEMTLYLYYLPPDIGPIQHESVSFERNHIRSNIVEHPKFEVVLYGTDIVEGAVGNTSILNGNGQFVDLGDHSDSFVDNLEKSDSGLTLSFYLKPKSSSYSEGQVVLSGNSYDISIQDRRLVVKFMTEDRVWQVKSYPLAFDKWNVVDLSWKPDMGLSLFINDTLLVEDNRGRYQPRGLVTNKLYAGKAQNQVNRQYFNGEIDEIRFWRAGRQELVKKGIITKDRCDIHKLIVSMDEIQGNRIVHPTRDITVHNNPSIVKGLDGNAVELQQFQSIDVGSKISCQSRPNACANGFTMRFAMKPDRLTRNSYIISSNPAEVAFGNDGNLHVRYRSASGIWDSTLSGLERGVWYTIDLSWDAENGMTVYVNNVQRSWLQKSNSPISNYNQANHFFFNKPSSNLISNYEQSSFTVDNLQIWDAKLELLKACGLLPPAPERIKHHAIYPPEGTGYIRLVYVPSPYDKINNVNEDLTIRFSANSEDGLLWYNADGDIKSYVYLKNGQLWFVTQNGDGPKLVKLISNMNLADGKDYELKMEVINGNQIRFKVNDALVNTINTDHRVKVMYDDFSVGGHRKTSEVTGGDVTRNFVGIIKDVKINGDKYDDVFDLFAEMWKKEFPVYVRTHCDVTYDPYIQHLCDHGESPVTFLKNDTYIYSEEWANIGRKPSLELRFTTVEPRGLLFFTGEKNGPYFALEVFDRMLYMITDLGNGPIRRQISPGEVANNAPHTAKFVFNIDEDKINIYFDGDRQVTQEISLNGIKPGKTLFSGNVYLGGYNDYEQLPWHIWSRSGFMGCVEEMQINGISSRLQDLYKQQGAKNIVDGCLPYKDYCSPNPCQNGGLCLNRKDRYVCDCTGMIMADYQNDVCSKLTLVGNLGGYKYYDLDLGNTLRTHVLDISTMFKTPADSGTLWMTNNPLNNDYIKVFMENGELKVATSINNVGSETRIPGKLNDNEWHTINVRRRANFMNIWVDDDQPATAGSLRKGQVDLREKDFYLYLKTIRLGADIPNPGEPPYFFGHMRNFRVTPDPNVVKGFDRVPPFVDAHEWINMYNVTFLTPEAYLRLGNTANELKADFKVIMSIKTNQENSLILYQPGETLNQYLAALLNNGRLTVRFNFGSGDEFIAVPEKYLSDDKWHTIEIHRQSIDTVSVRVDYSSRKVKKLDRDRVLTNLQFDHGDVMYLGGIPNNVLLPVTVRNLYSNGYRGCMTTFVKSRKIVDLGAEHLQDPEVRFSKSVVRGCQAQPECNDEQCKNGCKCSSDRSVCDSAMHPFHGLICELPDIGFKFFEEGEFGQVTFRHTPVISTTEDMISFGFITCHPDGIMAKLTGGNDREKIKIFMEGGKVVAEYQLGGGIGRLSTQRRYDNSKLYTVQFTRDGNNGRLKLVDIEDTTDTEELVTYLAGDRNLDGIKLVEVGSETEKGRAVNGFKGIIFGFKHNKYAVFNLAKDGQHQTTIKQPGTSVIRSGNPKDEFICQAEKVDCGPGSDTCLNYGVCMNNKCNCTLTAYAGRFCDEEPTGHYYGWNNFKPGIFVKEYPQSVSTMNDYFAVGIMTYEPTGTIFRAESQDGSQYYQVRLVDGKARLEYNLNSEPKTIIENRAILNSTESVYHVIRMNRTDGTINFFVDDLQLSVNDSNIVNTRFNQKRIMSGARHYKTNRQYEIQDDWNGILGGLYYNGIMLFYSNFNDDDIYHNGDLKIADHPFRLRFPPPPICKECMNGGRKLESGLCDCLYTTFTGECCDSMQGLYGFQHKKLGANSVIVYVNDTMNSSHIDDLSVAFRTAAGWENGEIVRVESKDGKQYVIVEIFNGRLQVKSKIGNQEAIEEFLTIDVRDKNDHILRLHRNGENGWIKLDQQKRTVRFPNADIFDANIIYAGGYTQGGKAINGHYGIVWGLNYNGVDVVKKTRAGDGVKLVTGDTRNFEIHEYPWPPLCDKQDCNVTPPPPTAPGGAGAVIAGMGGGGVGVVEPVVGVPVSSTPAISTGAIVGAVMGGLLFTTAIAWAAAGMKPGFMSLSKGLAGAAGKGAYVPVAATEKFPVSSGNNYLGTVGMEELSGSQAGSRRSQYDETYTHESKFDAADGSGMNGAAGMGGGYNAYNTASSWYTRNETLENQQHGYGAGTGSTMGYGNGRAGYAGSVAGGSISGSVYGFGTVTNPDQAFITLSEDIAVDNVVLTADGRYVVTGSNLGPPQVWNTNNGEMVTTMRGDFMGSTGLHLAANEQYLVGETMAEQAAVDMNDIQTGNHIPIRRLAVWDFNTGNPLPIAVDQLCTASCVSKDGYKVVMAMTDKFGGGTTVKVLDLLSNQILHELTYPDTIGVADSASCVFISPDDRFVAVGFTNSFDNNANFIVFDLLNKTGVVDSPIVALNADPHCTVILNHDEALTGTRNGELVIWSMKTGKAQRQLTSGDATMLSHGGMPAAHDREVKEVSLSDDGKYLASASADRTVKIWNMDTESLLHTLHGHNDEVWTVDIASDNSIIVSGSQDGTIKLWRLRNGNQITSFNATMDIFHARFSKDKKTVVALGDKYGARKLIMLQIISQKKWRVRNS